VGAPVVGMAFSADENICTTSLIGNVVIGEGATLNPVITVKSWAPFKTSIPPSFCTTTSPTKPSDSSMRTTRKVWPSGISMPSWVPRMPMVATGVVNVMASGSVLATWPLTKVKIPWTTDRLIDPDWVPGS